MFIEHMKPAVREQRDRSMTVGASEIGACARQTWFHKRGQPEEKDGNWGYGERGLHIERWFYASMRQAGFHIHHKQYKISKDSLSATIDGVTNHIMVDGKSFDPYKKTVVDPMHVWQVQCQIGLWNEAFKRKVDFGVLVYINASNFQDMREEIITPNPEAYAAAHTRATYIMTTDEPPPREGVLTGGKECSLCPFQVACLGREVSGLGDLSEGETAAIAVARELAIVAQGEADAAALRVTAEKEKIREILRKADVRRAPGLARISRSQRTSLDQDALKRSGVNLEPFRKAGRETETVTVE